MIELSKPRLIAISEDYPKIKTYDTKEQINGLINFLINFLNIKVTGEAEQKKLDMQMVMVYDLIKTKFGHLTFEEIREAMKMYVTNSFSDIKVFRLLDCVAIGEILTAYVDFRNEATFIYRDKKSKLLAQTTDLTKDEKDSIVWGGVNRIFKEYKETNVIDEPNEYIFDFLAEKGLIKLASESTPLLDAYYKQKIYQAKKDLLRENRPLQATNKSDVIDLENITKHIKDGTSPKIFIRAKHLVLKDYFDKNIDNNEIV